MNSAAAIVRCDAHTIARQQKPVMAMLVSRTLQRIDKAVPPDARGLAEIAHAVGLGKTTVTELVQARKMPVFLWGGRHCGYSDLLFQWSLGYRPKRLRQRKGAR